MDRLEQATQRPGSLNRQLDMAFQSFHEASSAQKPLFDSTLQGVVQRVTYVEAAMRELQDDRAPEFDFRQRLVAMEGGMTNHADMIERMDADAAEAINEV